MNPADQQLAKVTFTLTALTAVGLLVALVVTGRSWADKYSRLETETKQWRTVGSSPVVVEEALSRYWTIKETLDIAELGIAYKRRSNEVIQCFSVTETLQTRTYAGL